MLLKKRERERAEGLFEGRDCVFVEGGMQGFHI